MAQRTDHGAVRNRAVQNPVTLLVTISASSLLHSAHQLLLKATAVSGTYRIIPKPAQKKHLNPFRTSAPFRGASHSHFK